MVNSVEIPQFVKFICSKSHLKGSLEKIGGEYGLQPELLKREIDHSVFDKSIFADLKNIWEPYHKLDVFYLAFICNRYSIEMQKMTGFGNKDCLTEASLGWKCSGTYKKIENFIRLTINKSEILYAEALKEGKLVP